MSLAVFPRVLAFFLVLPLAGLPVRLVAGLVCAFALGSLPPAAPSLSQLTMPAVVAEALLGMALGVFAGIPVHAARGIRGDGPAALAFTGRIWAWTIFFAAGGPGLLLLGLARSFDALPAGAWPDATALVDRGHLLFYAALVLGLPLFLGALLVEPAAALVDRLVGAPLTGLASTALRGVIAPLALLMAAPFLADEVRGLFWAALS